MINSSGISINNQFLSPLVTRLLLGTLLTVVTLRYGAGLYAWKVANALEKPSYTIIKCLTNGVELRRYEPYLIAETEVAKEGFRESTGDGFRSCAGYIFGKNKARNGGGGGGGAETRNHRCHALLPTTVQ